MLYMLNKVLWTSTQMRTLQSQVWLGLIKYGRKALRAENCFESRGLQPSTKFFSTSLGHATPKFIIKLEQIVRFINKKKHFLLTHERFLPQNIWKTKNLSTDLDNIV